MSTLEDRSPCSVGPRWGRREYGMRRLKGFRGVVMLGDLMHQLTIELKERAEGSVAQLHGTADNRAEDRTYIGLRPADDAQNLSSRRLTAMGLR